MESEKIKQTKYFVQWISDLGKSQFHSSQYVAVSSHLGSPMVCDQKIT